MTTHAPKPNEDKIKTIFDKFALPIIISICVTVSGVVITAFINAIKLGSDVAIIRDKLDEIKTSMDKITTRDATTASDVSDLKIDVEVLKSKVK